MKGKISKDGSFYVERAGKMKLQGCPVATDDIFCGDWCPAFREQRWDSINNCDLLRWHLDLCSLVGTLIFDKFIDERI